MEKGIRLGGRQKGTSNKLTIEAREKVIDFIDRDLDDFFNEFQDLEVIDKMNIRKWVYSLGIPKERDVNLNDKREKRPQTFFEKKFAAMTREEKLTAMRDSIQILENEGDNAQKAIE